MRTVKSQIERLAKTDITALICGPSGTGKELVARLIHKSSPRRDHPWVPINCGAIPHDLFESELFGHQPGAFTGANKKKKGLIASAQGGTLFLDEIGELPMTMQVKLLRAIQERMIRPVGSTTEHRVDIRIVAASHQPLDQLVQTGRFRLDLYHRLDVARIELPSLDQMKDDLPLLIHFLTAKAATTHGLTPKALDPSALAALQRHHFSGNVRELEHRLIAGLLWSRGTQITETDLQLGKPQASAEHQYWTDGSAGLSLSHALNQTESNLINKALATHGNNHLAAAEQLGISERSLRYRINKLKHVHKTHESHSVQ